MRNNRYNPFQLIANNAAWFKKATMELRTTEVPRIGNFGLGYVYESCLFTKNDSEVQERYQTLREAVEGHIKLCQKFNLKNNL